MTPAEFIAAIGPAARASMAVTGVPASFVIAQAALESSWGRSELATKGCNLFGVKADKAWKGDVLLMPTREFIKGQWVTVEARWRRYAGWRECLDDHALFLLNNQRYRGAFAHAHDGREFARAVAAAGYATDPQYAAKIISVIDARKLTTYDMEASS